MADSASETSQEPADVAQVRRRRMWILVAAIVAAVVAAAALAWTLAPRPSAEASTGATSPAASSPSVALTSEAPSATPDLTPTPESSLPADGAVPFPELPPVSPGSPATAEGIEVALTKFESVTGQVVVSGEVEGPAVRVTVGITNTGGNPLDLNLVVMSAFIGPDRDPAETYQQPGGVPVSGALEPGATATGVYLFRIPEDRRDDVTLVVDYQGGTPALTWRGQIP